MHLLQKLGAANVKFFIILLFITSFLFAQETPSVNHTPIEATLGSPSETNPLITQGILPSNFVGFGTSSVGINPFISGYWVDFCGKTNQVIYTCLATDYINSTIVPRVGIETILLHSSHLFFTMKGDAGAAANSAGMGGAYGFGGSLIYKPIKTSNFYLVSSVSMLKESAPAQQMLTPNSNGNYILSNVPTSSHELVIFRFGVGKSF